MSKKEDLDLRKEFALLARDILHSAEFREMKKYRSHVNTTLYDHCVKVAYLCFKHHKRKNMKMDIAELVRGALLHDFYLYNLHDKTELHKLHWFRHPKSALQNALAKYPSLTKTEMDMIKNHMFPLTPCPPKTKAGWLICFYDKITAVSDRFGEKRREQTRNDFEKRKNNGL